MSSFMYDDVPVPRPGMLLCACGILGCPHFDQHRNEDRKNYRADLQQNAEKRKKLEARKK